MPHLTMALSAEGCALTLYVNVSRERQLALQASGQAVPNFVAVGALIDTGASCTAIDADKLAPLGMTPTGISQVHTPSTGGTAANMPQYDVMVGITHPSGSPLLIETVPILAVPKFARGGIDALIGMDILARCLFIFNGTDKNFTLAF